MSQEIIDITDMVEFGAIDGDILNFNKCACGKEFEDWDFLLSVGEEWAKKCPKCGREMFFSYNTRVFEIREK